MAIQKLDPFQVGQTRKETLSGVSQAALAANEAYGQFQKELAQEHGIRGGQVVIRSQKIELADKLGLATGGNYDAKVKAADEYINQEWQKQSGLTFNPYGRSNFGVESEFLKQSGYDITDYLELEKLANLEAETAASTPEAMAAEKSRLEQAIKDGVWVNPEVLSKYGLTQSSQAVAPGTPEAQPKVEEVAPTGITPEQAKPPIITTPTLTEEYIPNETVLQQKRDELAKAGIPQGEWDKYIIKKPDGRLFYVKPTTTAPTTTMGTNTRYLANEAELQQARQELASSGIPQNEWSKYISSPDAQGKIYFTPPSVTTPTEMTDQQLGLKAAQDRIAAGTANQADRDNVAYAQKNGLLPVTNEETTVNIDNVVNDINNATTDEDKDKLISDFISLAASKGLDFPESYIRAMTATTSDEKEKIKQDIYDKYGIDDLEAKIAERPTETYEDIYKRVSGDLNLQTLRDEINVIRAKIADVEEARDKRIKDFNDNPFYSEFGRVGQVKQVSDEARQELTRLTNQLTLTQNILERGETEAQNTALRVLNEFDTTREWTKEELNYYTERANADIEAELALLSEDEDKLVAKYFPEYVQQYQKDEKMDLTTEFKNWTLAGGEEGTGMTYAKWLDRNVKKTTTGAGTSFTASEKKKLEAAGLLNAPRSQQLEFLYPQKEEQLEPQDLESGINEILQQNNLIGSDGMVSWETYLDMKKTWIANGGKSSDFALYFPQAQWMDEGNQNEYYYQTQ